MLPRMRAEQSDQHNSSEVPVIREEKLKVREKLDGGVGS